jgi:hypothetical protein
MIAGVIVIVVVMVFVIFLSYFWFSPDFLLSSILKNFGRLKKFKEFTGKMDNE